MSIQRAFLVLLCLCWFVEAGVNTDRVRVSDSGEDADDVVTYAAMSNYIYASYAEGYATNGTLTLSVQNVFYPWTTWTPGNYSAATIGWTNNGVYIKEGGQGLYSVVGNLSVEMDANTEELHSQVWRGANGVATQACPEITGSAWYATANVPYPIPCGGLVIW